MQPGLWSFHNKSNQSKSIFIWNLKFYTHTATILRQINKTLKLTLIWYPLQDITLHFYITVLFHWALFMRNFYWLKLLYIYMYIYIYIYIYIIYIYLFIYYLFIHITRKSYERLNHNWSTTDVNFLPWGSSKWN